jgi:hypothetical protein
MIRVAALALLFLACGNASADGVVCMVCDQTIDCMEIGPEYFCSTANHKCTKPCQSDTDCPSNLKCDTHASACICP